MSEFSAFPDCPPLTWWHKTYTEATHLWAGYTLHVPLQQLAYGWADLPQTQPSLVTLPLLHAAAGTAKWHRPAAGRLVTWGEDVIAMQCSTPCLESREWLLWHFGSKLWRDGKAGAEEQKERCVWCFWWGLGLWGCRACFGLSPNSQQLRFSRRLATSLCGFPAVRLLWS